MTNKLVKSLAMRAVSMGLRLPEGQLDRISELSHLRALLGDLGINCVLDVGANRGQFATELRAIGYTGHIISFEPVEREFVEASRRLAGDPKWKGYQIALGSEEMESKINVTQRSDLSSLLRLRDSGTVLHRQDVSVRRLDGILPALVEQIPSARIFLKMDTQGFDVEVFRGASGCIKSVLGLQSELSITPIYERMPHYIQALAEYEALGFELYNISPVARMFGKGLVEVNCFMKRSPSRPKAGMDKETAVYLKHLAAGL